MPQVNELQYAALGEIALLDPELLPESTEKDFSFDYYDLSSVESNRVGKPIKYAFAEAPSRARKVVRPGDVLMSTVRPNLKGFSQFPRNYLGGVASTGFAVIRGIDGVSDSGFIAQCLFHSSIERQINQLVTGSNYPAITVGNVKRLLLPRFTIGEQKRIAEVLSAVDEQIEIYQSLMEKQELIAKGLQADISEMKCDWVQLGNHFEIQSGTTPSRARENYYGEGMPWVKTLDLCERELFNTDEYLTETALQECKPRVVPVKSVLVAMYGGWQQIGRTALLGRECCTNQAISSILPGDCAAWDMRFVFHSLKALRYKWRRYGVSTRKDPNITKADVSSFNVPMPEISEQISIADRLDAAFCLIDEYKTLIEKSTELKSALMSDLLTGKTRVPV